MFVRNLGRVFPNVLALGVKRDASWPANVLTHTFFTPLKLAGFSIGGMAEDAETGLKNFRLRHTDTIQANLSTIDLDTLNLVEDVIRRMKENGGAMSAIGALDNDLERSVILKIYSSVYLSCLILVFPAKRHGCERALNLSKLQNTLEHVNRFKDALTLLRNGATSVQALTRRNIAYISFRRGIGRLPDEVLSLIFAHSCEDRIWSSCARFRSKALVNLASVCMRFRIIILAMSRLWTYISSNMPPGRVDMQLVHSREQPLVIKSDWVFDVFKYTQVHHKLLRHAHRWEQLEIDYMKG